MRVRQIRTTLLILKISVAFVVCWLPYAALGIVVAANKFKQHTNTFIMLYYMSINLAYSNSALNVFIYGMGNTILSEEVKKLLKSNKIRCTWYSESKSLESKSVISRQADAFSVHIYEYFYAIDTCFMFWCTFVVSRVKLLSMLKEP